MQIKKDEYFFKIFEMALKYLYLQTRALVMKRNLTFSWIIFLLTVAITSCNTSYESQTLQYKTYRINDSLQKDAADELLEED